MHFGDTIVIFVLALILFGPKKLPEIGRQIAKLLAEFRRASNEFKMQIDEELRSLEQQERQKQIAAAATTNPPEPVSPAVSSNEPTIQPPSTGETVSASSPYSQQYHMEGPKTDESPDWSAAAETATSIAADTSESRLEGPPPDLEAAAAEAPILPTGSDTVQVTPAIDLIPEPTRPAEFAPPEAEHPSINGTLNGSSPAESAARSHEDPVPENAHNHG